MIFLLRLGKLCAASFFFSWTTSTIFVDGVCCKIQVKVVWPNSEKVCLAIIHFKINCGLQRLTPEKQWDVFVAFCTFSPASKTCSWPVFVCISHIGFSTLLFFVNKHSCCFFCSFCLFYQINHCTIFMFSSFRCLLNVLYQE